MANVPKHDILKEFRDPILNAHDKDKCHWSTGEDTRPTAGAAFAGPCTCPSKKPCNHKLLKCSSTGEVLKTSTNAETKNKKNIDTLQDNLRTIEETIATAYEALNKIVQGGTPMGQAVVDPTFAKIMHGRYDSEKRERQKILDLPSDFSGDIKKDPNPNDCPHDCKPNKEKRIDEIDKLIKEVGKLAQKAQQDIETDIKNLAPTYKSTLGRVVKDSKSIVSSIIKPSVASPANIGKALADLGDYLNQYKNDAATMFAIYVALANLAFNLKGRALNLAIYEEQMIHSPTCTDR